MNELLTDCPIVITQDLVWADMDAYQHINNAVYFTYFEIARMAYFEKIGVSQYKEQNNIGPILASTKADFKAPLKYPDTINIAAKITSIANKKLSMQYSIHSQTLNKIVAQGEALIVYFDYANGKSCEIPENIVKQIHQLEINATQESPDAN